MEKTEENEDNGSSKEEGKKKKKTIKEAKGYSRKIKRHKDAVLALHSVDGLTGEFLISGSADHTCRIWNLAEQKITVKIDVNRPKDNELFKYKDHASEVVNYAPEHILNTPGALQRQRNNRFVCCFCFQQQKIYTGYEDGLICSWDQDGNFTAPLIGHTNRINCILSTDTNYIVTTSNDCTVRQWEYDTGVCIAIFKFADPISVAKVSARYNMLFTASWDKMVRCVDLEQNKVMKSFIASKEAIKCMEVYQNWIFVAGCDPIIRSFDLTGGDPHRPEIPNQRMYQGHKGWIYTIQVLGTGYKKDDQEELRMYSGGDDRSIIIWDVLSGKMLEQLTGHENGVTSIAFGWNDLYTGSFDHHIIQWNLKELNERIEEKKSNFDADVESRRYEVYWRLMDAKGKKKKKGKGGAKKAAGGSKKKKK